MEHVMCVALLWYCFVITTGTDGQPPRNVRIENCIDKFIDIQENANNTILCKGFHQSDIIEWSIERDGHQKQRVATCDPRHNCTVHQPDHFAVERSPSQSTLFYKQYDRGVDARAIVFCKSLFATGDRTASCKLTVINPAELSYCTVDEDRYKGTVRGSCRFYRAFAHTRGFFCTWYQEKDEQSRLFRGNITYDSGPQSPCGWCTFTSTVTTWEPGTYTYIIFFYPGPGNITVDTRNIHTNRPMPTRGTTPGATCIPDLSHPTDNTDYTSPKPQEEVEENDLPVGAITGGIVGVVAVIIIIVVVVVVVVIRRKQRQKPAGSAKGPSNDASNENDDFEEHVNPMYITSQDPDDTHTTDHNHSTIAPQMSPNSHNGHPAAPHSLDADMYTTVDGEARFAPSNQASDMGGRSGGYEDIGFGSNGNKRVPQKDEYAVVDKSRAKKGPASSANTSASSPAHTTERNNEYAVVDKSSSRNKATKNVASGLSNAANSNAGADVYAQVNKTAKKVKVAETERAAYAQVQKPKPATKPKTSAKPSSHKDVTKRSAADDDEYHTLRHTRGSPETQEQADLESQYSHIGHD